MRKRFLIIAVAVVARAASLQAATIAGTIGYTGAFTPANSDLTTPNDVLTISGAKLTGLMTGSFTGGTLSHFANLITINATVPPGFANPLWQVTVGAITYSFTASDVSTVTDTSTINTISGHGTISDGLGNSAPGSYNLSFLETRVGPGLATFAWAGTSGAPDPVPDGATTLMLLGSALAGLGLIRRKLA
jgi:hypothetical protein